MLTRFDGSKLELKGGDATVVLAFVSRRSPPCRPLLAGLGETAAAAGRVRFVAVVEDRDAEPLDPLPAGFAVVRDTDKSLAARYQVSILPTVVVLDRQLGVAFREEGFGLRTAGRLAGALAAGGKQP